MKERPILFSGDMVRAILDGRKTQTRRVVKPQTITQSLLTNGAWKDEATGRPVRCHYGQPGDRLWVRETFAVYGDKDRNAIHYRADRPHQVGSQYGWKPSIHMPRWASRITLEIVSVRVERLNEISEEDAVAEGARYHDGHGVGHSGWRHDYGDVYVNALSSFAGLWESINGAGSWEANPWVWVIEFKRIAGGE